mgnify:CR=1 FL=1
MAGLFGPAQLQGEQVSSILKLRPQKVWIVTFSVILYALLSALMLLPQGLVFCSFRYRKRDFQQS